MDAAAPEPCQLGPATGAQAAGAPPAQSVGIAEGGADTPPHAKPARPVRRHRVLRSLGLGLITGAADDDCSAIGTFAQAGAQFGYRILWIAPLILPMMVAVVYLSGKLGQVTGQGLFSVLRTHAPRWLLYTILVG